MIRFDSFIGVDLIADEVDSRATGYDYDMEQDASLNCA